MTRESTNNLRKTREYRDWGHEDQVVNVVKVSWKRPKSLSRGKESEFRGHSVNRRVKVYRVSRQ